MPSARIVRRDDTVLVVIDVQERLAAVMEHRADMVATTLRLLGAAALFGWPVAVTRQYPQGLGGLDPVLRESLAGEDAPAHRLVDKTAFSCMREPSFVGALEEGGRRQLVLAGMETHICVTQTALDALSAGYEVFVVADAVCSRREADHAIALERLRSEGAVVLPSESVLYEAAGAAATDEFRALLRIVKE